VLFPEVELANPDAGGPTRVMRMEHQQMRQLLDELAAPVRTRDRDTCLGDLETLHMLNQQHNAKEEGILYPLADRALQDNAVGLLLIGALNGWIGIPRLFLDLVNVHLAWVEISKNQSLSKGSCPRAPLTRLTVRPRGNQNRRVAPKEHREC